MTDLVTRLLALADSCPSPYCSGNCSFCGTFREAADALTQTANELAEEEEREAKWMKRYDELEAKLAAAEKEWREAAREREAWLQEAAFVRKLADDLLNKVNAVTARWRLQGIGAAGSGAKALEDLSNHQVDVEEALSQPSPGAAYQEHVRKLEAVAEAARVMMDESRPPGEELAKSDMLAVIRAIAALEETP